MQKQVKTYELNDDLKKRCYSVLNSVLSEYGISFQYFYLGGFIDGYVCLEYMDENWIVYEGSRGEKIHLKEFKSFYEAGCSLFDSIVIENEKQEEMNGVLKARLEGMLLRNGLYSPKIISFDVSENLTPKNHRRVKVYKPYSFTDVEPEKGKFSKGPRRKQPSPSIDTIPRKISVIANTHSIGELEDVASLGRIAYNNIPQIEVKHRIPPSQMAYLDRASLEISLRKLTDILKLEGVQNKPKELVILDDKGEVILVIQSDKNESQ